MSRELLPPLRCESRRPLREPWWFKWTFGTVIIGASLLDGLWLFPAQRDSRPESNRARIELRMPACHDDAPVPPQRERRVNDILLRSPR
jgi:hypothetical protein